MKKLVLLMVLFLGVMSMIMAQGDNPQIDRAGRQTDPSSIIDSRVEDLTEMLSLNSSQVAQVKAIYEKTLGTGSEISVTANSEQRHNEIMELLNSDQKEIYSAYLEERETRMRGSEISGRRAADPSSIIDSRVKDLTERLSLTISQVDQVRAIYEKTLGTESRGSIISNSEERHNQIMELLNEEQKKIYESYLEERETPSRERPASERTTRSL